MIEEAELAITLVISLHISKIANVSRDASGTSMSIPVWVVVRSCSGASLKQISILVNVEPMQLAGS